MTLDQAKDLFESTPNKANAVTYFRELVTYMLDYQIDKGTFDFELAALVKTLKDKQL